MVLYFSQGQSGLSTEWSYVEQGTLRIRKSAPSRNKFNLLAILYDQSTERTKLFNARRKAKRETHSERWALIKTFDARYNQPPAIASSTSTGALWVKTL